MKDGYAQIRNGKITVRDPLPGGKHATIKPVPPVVLRKNNEWLTGEERVSASDVLDWAIQEPPLFEIVVSPDKLEASFILHAAARHAWEMKDAGPARRLELEATRDRQVVLETVHLADVLASAESQGIRMNVDAAVIQRELVEQTGQPVVFAAGLAPVPGVDARIEHFFASEIENSFFEIGGKIDFRNHLHIPSVKAGEVIAQKYPAVRGKTGYNVFGQAIVPPEPKEIVVEGSKHVDIADNGQILSRIGGRPRVFVSGNKRRFDISKIYTVYGNVDIETGNIAFSGDVVIHGNIMDNMIIEALGNVYVYGSVFHSTITAAGSVHVRGNVIGSKLYSGYFGVLYNRLYKTAKALDEKSEKLLNASLLLNRMLAQRGKTAPFGLMIRMLLESKYGEIPELIRQLMEVVVDIRQMKRGAYKELYEQALLFQKLSGAAEQVSESLLLGFHSLLRSTWQQLVRMQEKAAVIAVNQCNNSELQANGNIVIHREGVLRSQLTSGRSILFKYTAAVCRGSHLEAGDSIVARAVGGRSGAPTLLKAKNKIYVSLMLAGRVCIGRSCMDLISTVAECTFDADNIHSFSQQ